MARWSRTLALLAVLTLLVGACGRGGDGGTGQGGGRWQEEIVIGWTPPDITGVFKTATEFFEKAANEANAAGFKVKVESRSPTTHTAFADQVAIIDDFVSRKVDVIAISPADTRRSSRP
jgi:ribose transport system substrate-binding protein